MFRQHVGSTPAAHLLHIVAKGSRAKVSPLHDRQAFDSMPEAALRWGDGAA